MKQWNTNNRMWLLKFLSNLKAVRYFSFSFWMTVSMHACTCMYINAHIFLHYTFLAFIWCFFNVLITLSLFLLYFSLPVFMVYWTLRRATFCFTALITILSVLWLSGYFPFFITRPSSKLIYSNFCLVLLSLLNFLPCNTSYFKKTFELAMW